MKSYKNAIRATMCARREDVASEVRIAAGKGLIAVYLASVLAGLLAVFLGYVISR